MSYILGRIAKCGEGDIIQEVVHLQSRWSKRLDFENLENDVDPPPPREYQAMAEDEDLAELDARSARASTRGVRPRADCIKVAGVSS